jgi:hypothetical protein
MIGPLEISGNMKGRILNKAGKFQLRPEKSGANRNPQLQR